MNINIAPVLTVVGIMTLCLVVTKPSANHAFAKTFCFLKVDVDPGDRSLATGESIEQKISGTLHCGNPQVSLQTTGLGGATISFGGIPGSAAAESVTDSSGNFQGPHFLVHAGDSLRVSVTYRGDSEHNSIAVSIPITMSSK